MDFLNSDVNVMSSDSMDHIFDLKTYPIDDLSHPATQALVARCQQALNDVGCAVIRNLVRHESIARMQAEAERKIADAYWSQDSHNPYMTKDDNALPHGHPKRFFEKRESGYINSDVLDEDSDLGAIYGSQVLLDFVSACFDVAPIYCWADPLGSHPYSIMDENHYFPWHFDGNDFTVSILIQESDEGGLFEYVPNIRSAEDENFAAVNRVLHGGRDGVHALRLRSGDMQLFKGRFSMHRVTRVKGKKKRIIALPTYVVDPYTVNRPERAKQLYGRALPIHYEREAHRSDGLTD